MNFSVSVEIESLLASDYWSFIDQFRIFFEGIAKMTEREFHKKHGKSGYIEIEFEKNSFEFSFRTVPGKVIFTSLERF